MKVSLHRALTLGLSTLLLYYGGCSVGTNTGNGGGPGSTGDGGSAGSSGGGGSTGGKSGYCLGTPCQEPVSVVDGDGQHYRGSMNPNATLAASYNHATSANPNPPQVEMVLEFAGTLVEESDAGCINNINPSAPSMSVDIYLCAADSSIDDTGALRVQGAPLDGVSGPFASFAMVHDSGAQIVDLRITPDAHVTATLSGKTDPWETDAGVDASVITVDGLLWSGNTYGLDGGLVHVSMPVSDGRTYVFPYWTPPRCGDWARY